MGRNDILVIRYDQGRLRNRTNLIQREHAASFDLLAGYAMTFLMHRRWVKPTSLGAALGTDSKQTRRILSILNSRGLIEEKPHCIKAKTLSSLWVIDSIESYEVKLNDWRRVIEQAGRHLWFASKSYVAMPHPSNKVNQLIKHCCHDYHIGAILCKDDSTWVSAARPPYRKIPSTQIGWLLNESIVGGATNGRL